MKTRTLGTAWAKTRDSRPLHSWDREADSKGDDDTTRCVNDREWCSGPDGDDTEWLDHPDNNGFRFEAVERADDPEEYRAAAMQLYRDDGLRTGGCGRPGRSMLTRWR